MAHATRSQLVRSFAVLAALLPVFLVAQSLPAQQTARTPLETLAAGGEATLEADQQRQVRKVFYADGHVDINYQNTRLRADHAEYDSEAQVVTAKGNVQLDYLTQHI